MGIFEKLQAKTMHGWGFEGDFLYDPKYFCGAKILILNFSLHIINR